MRILCCLDGTNAEQIGRVGEMLSATQPLTLGLLHVIDSRPRKDIDLIRERFLRAPLHPPHRPPPGPPPHHAPPPAPPPHHIREEEMSEAERASAQEILNEGRRYFAAAEALEREGRPELEIVNLAAEWRADLVVVCSRAAYQKRREIGPKSVGHVARFVLDHAPCPVLLLRPLARELFPIER
jgi:nucleotide-binding universal stress UspA family protein